MIRFRCPVCNKMLKVPDDKAGSPVVCPQCGEPSAAPAVSAPYLDALEPSAPRPEPAPGIAAGMSGWLRAAFALVAAIGLLSLLLAIAGPSLGLSEDLVATARSDARFIIPACLVLLLALIYAHLTTCPACGKWWARMEGETNSLHREALHRGRVRRVRALRETSYVCKYCRHTWSATYTDEYEQARRPRRGEPK
jgi:hypothetical protein